MIKSKIHQVQSIYVIITKRLKERYKSVTLSADFMFINGIHFFLKLSHYIKI